MLSQKVEHLHITAGILWDFFLDRVHFVMDIKNVYLAEDTVRNL